MKNNLSHIPKIRVVVRKRPLSKKQESKGEKDIIEIPDPQTVVVKQQKVKVDLTPYTDEYKFIFDGAFGEHASNEQIYLSCVQPLIDAAFDGARVSCFAYGQTGSGKTHTMLGNGKGIRGMYLLAAEEVFGLLDNFQNVSVWVSFYEIYCGKLFDLLNERSILYARQDAKNNINIVGLSETRIHSTEEIMQIIEFGTGARVTSQNSTNVDSSRSHAILQISLKKANKVHGKISFIDLAGSERAADHADQTDKQTRIDGAEINKSLLALKECIRALDQNKNHTPFRGSKLTMVLKDSFTGYCKTVMIGNVSPNSSSCENTLNTLKYADRVKELKKSNRSHEKGQDFLLNDLSKELMLPRQMISHRQRIQSSDNEGSKKVPVAPQVGNFLKRADHNNQKMELENQQHNNKNLKLRKKSDEIRRNNQSSPNNWKQSRHSMLIPPYQPQRKNSSGNPSTNLQNGYRNSPNNNKNHNRSPQNDSHFKGDGQHESAEEIYRRLGQRHEEMMQKVIEGEENIISEHEQFINFSVENTKEHLSLMNEVDKVGSSIEGYLDKLEQNLENQIDRIYKLKAHLDNLRYNLDESKKVEALYLDINQESGGNGGHPNNYQSTPTKQDLDLGSANDEELLFDL